MTPSPHRSCVRRCRREGTPVRVLDQDAAPHRRFRALGALATAVAAATVATAALGVVAEPLLRLAERATMLDG